MNFEDKLIKYAKVSSEKDNTKIEKVIYNKTDEVVGKYIVEDNGELKGKIVATLGENPTFRKVFKILSVKDVVGLFPCEKGKIGFSKNSVARAICLK